MYYVAGLLHTNRTGEIEGGKARVGCYEEVLNMENMSRQDLLQLDWEGRCLVTDHGSFVLFNLYGPSVGPDNEERYEFKLRFYRALQNRWEGLLKNGRRVIAVGDFNISPFPIDSCHSDSNPDFDKSSIRQWFRSQLRANGGPFVDVFREIHPIREGAYTFWNQMSGSEEFNYGTRLDLIIAAGGCFHQVRSEESNSLLKAEESHHFGTCEVEDCDILLEFKRFKADSVPRRGGEKTQKLDGSDHVPVYVQLRPQPPLEQHDVPPLAARFMPEIRGRQQSIASFLQKRSCSLIMDIEAQKETKPRLSLPTATCVRKNPPKVTKFLKSQNSKQKSLHSFFMLPTTKGKENTEAANAFKLAFQDSDSETLLKPSLEQSQTFVINSPHDGGLALPEFDEGSIDASSSHMSRISRNDALPSSDSQETNAEPTDSSNTSSLKQDCTCESQNHVPEAVETVETAETNEKLSAKIEWQRIQKTMMNRVPMCSGHNEPCATYVMKKPGPNHGRKFHCCARAQGPSSNPEAKCKYFKWQNKYK